MMGLLKLVVLVSAHFTLCHLRVAVPSNEVLVSRGNAILRLYMSRGRVGEEVDQTVVVSAPSPVTAFDIHVARRQLFYSTGAVILRTPLYDLSTTTALAATGQVTGLAVDWVRHHVYWTDLGRGTVEAARLDGGGRRVVHHSRPLAPTGGLALDPQFGEMFWLERQPTRDGLRLMTSRFDGSQFKEVISDKHIPAGSPLAVDANNKGVYFYHGNGTSCEQWEVNYSWPERGVRIFTRNESCPTSLSVTADGSVYSNREGLWAGSWESSVITVAYGDTYKTFRILTPRFSLINHSLKDAAQVRVPRQTAWADQCSERRHPCAHDCVAAGLGHSACVCHVGYSLGPDHSSCLEQGYLVDRSSSAIGRAVLDGSGYTPLYQDPGADISAMDLYPARRLVYWADLAAEAIYRAPIDRPGRRETVVRGVSAYGVAVDWLHGLLYWTEHSRIKVSRLDGPSPTLTLLDKVDAPGAIAVDPVNKFIFWTECGIQRGVRRAVLDGGDVVSLSWDDDVSCDTTLALDPGTLTVVWRARHGALRSCHYSGGDVVSHPHHQPAAFTVHRHTVLWTSHLTHLLSSVEDIDNVHSGHHSTGLLSFKHVHFNSQAVEIRVMMSPPRPSTPDPCEDVDCPGLCLLSSNQTAQCVCSGLDKNNTQCANHETVSNKGASVKGSQYLTLMNTTAFSASLRCSGALLTHPVSQPYIQVEEVDSLVPRDNSRASFVVKVVDKSSPFTIDSLNPATSYQLTVRNRVTRAAQSVVLHTRPPPLAVLRLPVVTVPGVEGPIAWHPQPIHYSSPNVWELYIQREYMLLLVSENTYELSETPDVDETITSMLKKEIKRNFMILQHYKNKEDFDDDPTMHLANVPWGDQYLLAMVQVTQYRQQYNLDIVYSAAFTLPDHSQSYMS